MFPQFYFLSSFSSKSSSLQHKVSQIQKQLSTLASHIAAVVVGGQQESIILGGQLFGSQSKKKKMFIQPLMRNRMDEGKNKMGDLSSQRVQHYKQLYTNFEQFAQQRFNSDFHSENTQLAFTNRIKKLKQQLLHYRSHVSEEGNQKILLIADKQVLNYLGATDYHQNGEPVNRLHLNEGQLDLVSLVIDQEESIKELRKGDGIFCS